MRRLCLFRNVVTMKKHEKHENHTTQVRGAASIYEQSIIWGGKCEGADVVLCSGSYLNVDGVMLHPNLFAMTKTPNYGKRIPL